jgi:hypothetical protein
MLSFMRWTHRVYPYGPVWLGLTVPLSFIGFGLFLPTFFMFKALMAAAFLGSVYYIGKILQKIAPEKETFGLIFFGLQPLIVIESLVSGHMDIVMYFFALWSVYLLIQKKYFWSVLLLAVSIGIKFVTAFLLPIYIFIIIYQIYKKKIAWNKVFMASIILMILAVVAATLRSNFQPWYLIAPLVFAAFISYRYFIFIPSMIVSLFALFTYVPFLYSGNWDPPIPQMLNTMYIISYIISGITIVVYLLLRKAKR